MARQDTEAGAAGTSCVYVEVHWTSQSEADVLDEAGVRTHIVALRRLMMLMQVGLSPKALRLSARRWSRTRSPRRTAVEAG